jgi:hypothetical protein
MMDPVIDRVIGRVVDRVVDRAMDQVVDRSGRSDWRPVRPTAGQGRER